MANTSIYKNIKSAKDLLFKVKAHGFSTTTEDIVAAQDIFGNSSEEELVELANENNTRGVFYQVLFNIWHWEDATRFYNNHSNPLFREAKKAKQDVFFLEKEVEKLKNDDSIVALKKERDREQEKRFAAEQEVLVLKAKLYDMMVERQAKADEN